MSYRKWREMAIRDLAISGVSYETSVKILRLATRLQRAAEVLTSLPVSESEYTKLEKRTERDSSCVEKIADSLGGTVEFCRDPRGNPFTLRINCLKISVPGQSLPARCFA